MGILTGSITNKHLAVGQTDGDPVEDHERILSTRTQDTLCQHPSSFYEGVELVSSS